MLARALWTNGSLALDTDGYFRYLDQKVAKNAAAEVLAEETEYPRARHYAKGIHSCAAGWEGQVYCFGHNADGQLGYPASPHSLEFGRVDGLTDVVQVAVGNAHSCALGQDGNVRCWGANYSGQLGDGTLTQRLAPTLVKGLSGVRSIFAHTAQTCAILQSGKLSCWGLGERGQLGLAARQRKLSGQTRVASLERVVSIAAGTTHTCAMDTFGIASCWGQPTHGGHLCQPVGTKLRCYGHSSLNGPSGKVTVRSLPERQPRLSGGSALWAGGDVRCGDPQGSFRCLTSYDPAQEVEPDGAVGDRRCAGLGATAGPGEAATGYRFDGRGVPRLRSPRGRYGELLGTCGADDVERGPCVSAGARKHSRGQRRRRACLCGRNNLCP